MIRALILAVSFCASPAAAGQETVRFKTADGCAIEAWYLAPSTGAYVFVNTHGLGSGKYEWTLFQTELAAAGFGYLSLDLRGHGASGSCGGRKADHRTFSPADWNAASGDITAAAAWLAKKNIPGARLVYCGASIGANLSLKAASEGVIKPAGVILLSPGLSYAGVVAEPYLAAAGRLLVAASENDPYAWQSSAALVTAAARRGHKAAFLSGRGGHGVNMFAEPGLMRRLIGWAGKK